MHSKRYRKWFKHWRILLTLPFVKNCVAIKNRLNFQHLELNAYVTNLRAALGRFPHSPSCGGFLYLLVGSTECGGNARGFEEGI